MVLVKGNFMPVDIDCEVSVDYERFKLQAFKNEVKTLSSVGCRSRKRPERVQLPSFSSAGKALLTLRWVNV